MRTRDRKNKKRGRCGRGSGRRSWEGGEGRGGCERCGGYYMRINNMIVV